jgi:hypothetical protein
MLNQNKKIGKGREGERNELWGQFQKRKKETEKKWVIVRSVGKMYMHVCICVRITFMSKPHKVWCKVEKGDIPE